MDILKYLFNSIPLIIALFIYAIRLERRLTKIETNVEWIKLEIPKCQPSSDENTP
jgi:hypothetical protein